MTGKEQKAKQTEPMGDFEDMHNEGVDADEIAAAKETPAEKKGRKEKKADAALKALQANYDELNDKYLRLFSDFDNFRRRTMKEKLELSKTASEDVIIGLLSVVDDFERAIELSAKTEGHESVIEGIRLIYSKLIKYLQQKGLEEIDASGKAFDTDFHEALTNVPVPEEDKKGKVIDVIQKGYVLNGKVIRFAKVVVGS